MNSREAQYYQAIKDAAIRIFTARKRIAIPCHCPVSMSIPHMWRVIGQRTNARMSQLGINNEGVLTSTRAIGLAQEADLTGPSRW